MAVRDLHIVYRVYGARRVKPGSAQAGGHGIAARFLNRSKKGVTEVHAIRGVSFTAHKGESIGVVGTNGSGKTTLLLAIAGTLPPERGQVLSRSKPTLLGVNAALIPQLTGARNVEIGCLALGMSPEEAAKHFDEIVEFSGIGEFIDLPMTAYSSGMSARLRFAIASSVPHEVLLIDEALATGDVNFRVRSERRIIELREQASTVFLVSHDISTVLQTCDRGIWLDRGQVRMDGPVAEVAEAYEAEARMGRSAGAPPAPQGQAPAAEGQVPSGTEDDATAAAEPAQTRAAAQIPVTPMRLHTPEPAPTAEPQPAAEPESPTIPRKVRWLAPVTFLVSLAAFVLGSWRPDYWLDEATTLAAVRRSWPDVLRLFNGDPSLVPYYIVMKPFATLSEAEVWLRLPGAIAAAAAVTLLVIAVRRVFATSTAVVAGCVWLAMPTVSLYAQMVRPYAFLMLLVVGCAISWWRCLEAQGRRWQVIYAALVIAIGTMNMYALTVVGAFLAAAWFVPVADRKTSVLRTLVPAAVAAAILSPYLVLAVLRAPGAGRTAEFTPDGISATLAGAVGSPWLLIALVALAIIGVVSNRRGDSPARRLIVLAAVWAFALPVILVLAHLAGLPTLAPRYYVFALPALAVLAALGLRQIGSRWWPATVMGLLVVIVLGLPGQIDVREPGSHQAGAARSVSAIVQVPAISALPVVANPPSTILSLFSAYAPDVVANRMPLRLDPDARGRLLIYPAPSQEEATAALAPYPAVVLVAAQSTATSPPRPDLAAALQSNGFAQPWTTCSVGQTTVQVLARPSRTGELAPQNTIIDQIQQVAPKSRCALG